MQWRRRSKTQERFLQELERCNNTKQQAVATRTESDLRRIVHDGRALVRTWPSSPPQTVTTSDLPTTRKSLRRKAATNAVVTSTGNRGRRTLKGKGSVRNEVDDRSHHPSGASSVVYATVTGDQDELYSSAKLRAPIIDNSKEDCANHKTNDGPPETKYLPRKVQEGFHDSNNKSSNKSLADAPAATGPSGWFWGTGRHNPGGGGGSDGGDGGDVVGNMNGVGVTAPGEGTMAAFWRGGITGAHGAPGHNVAVASCAVASVAAGTPPHYSSSSHPHCCSGKPASAIGNTCVGDYPLKERSNNISSKANISVASAKAAVRSASNRMAQLSSLLIQRNKPPREECLAKAGSAVRAAQSAISCANERLFELELMAANASVPAVPVAGAEPAGRGKQPTVPLTDVHKSEKVEKSMNEEHHDNQGSASSSLCSSSSLITHIEQLTEQLELAQSLQAASIVARARLSRRFELEDAATIKLQALARGCTSRWREKCNNTRMAKPTDAKNTMAEEQPLRTRLHVQEEAGDLREGGTGKGGQESETVGAMLPRKEELWWTLAEAENADDVEEQESKLLRTVEKLQAIVRSRLARSKTITDVNARFFEHFDEEFQQPFYVCRETNSSQWNRPFGFGFGGGGRGLSSLPSSHGDGNEDEDARNCGVLETTNRAVGGRVELTLSDNLRSSEEEGLATGVVVQCTTREGVTEMATSTPSFTAKSAAGEMGGGTDSKLLSAGIKLQALVRSRLARSKAFATVNASFVEYFDEEHQHPFYVDTETNTSQWNRPFGFGFESGRGTLSSLVGGSSTAYMLEGEDASSSSATINVGGAVEYDNAARNSDNNCGAAMSDGAQVEAIERALRDTSYQEEAAAVAIQSAVRAARARKQLAEKIVLTSL